MNEIAGLSACEIARGVSSRSLSAEEVVAAHLETLHECRDLNAIITLCPERALARARAGVKGPLAGVPMLVKDLFDTAGIRTTYGSTIYAENIPKRTAHAVTLLERAGAILLGKSNLHEFAWGTTSQNPHWGYVHNPVLPGRVAGGSSGGNAAALAANGCALALGTDTAGSVRIPSACCGTVGLKPSYGRVDPRGCFPLSPTFDVIGPMARTVSDCALAYFVLAGTPIPEPRIEGLVVGCLARPSSLSVHEPGHLPHSGASAERFDEIMKTLELLGARVVEVELPTSSDDIVPIFLYEASVAHTRTFPSRANEYGADTRLKWNAAVKVTRPEAESARRALFRWRKEAQTEPLVDVFVTPTLGMEVPTIDVWEPDVRVGMIANTRDFSFLGWPAIAIGDVQIAGRDEQTVLGAALGWEAAGELTTARVAI